MNNSLNPDHNRGIFDRYVQYKNICAIFKPVHLVVPLNVTVYLVII